MFLILVSISEGGITDEAFGCRRLMNLSVFLCVSRSCKSFSTARKSARKSVLFFFAQTNMSNQVGLVGKHSPTRCTFVISFNRVGNFCSLIVLFEVKLVPCLALKGLVASWANIPLIVIVYQPVVCQFWWILYCRWHWSHVGRFSLMWTLFTWRVRWSFCFARKILF